MIKQEFSNIHREFQNEDAKDYSEALETLAESLSLLYQEEMESNQNFIAKDLRFIYAKADDIVKKNKLNFNNMRQRCIKSKEKTNSKANLQETDKNLVYLPTEILIQIFDYISHDDLNIISELSLTCQRFYSLVEKKRRNLFISKLNGISYLQLLIYYEYFKRQRHNLILDIVDFVDLKLNTKENEILATAPETVEFLKCLKSVNFDLSFYSFSCYRFDDELEEPDTLAKRFESLLSELLDVSSNLTSLLIVDMNQHIMRNLLKRITKNDKIKYLEIEFRNVNNNSFYNEFINKANELYENIKIFKFDYKVLFCKIDWKVHSTFKNIRCLTLGIPYGYFAKKSIVFPFYEMWNALENVELLEFVANDSFTFDLYDSKDLVDKKSLGAKPSLKLLEIGSNIGIDAIEMISECAPNLNYLYLHFQPFLNIDKGLESISKYLAQLKYLGLNGATFSNKLLNKVLKSNPNLTELTLFNVNIIKKPGYDFEKENYYHQIISLELFFDVIDYKSYWMNFDSFKELLIGKSIKYLYIYYINYTDVIEFLTERCPRLERIEIGICDHYNVLELIQESPFLSKIFNSQYSFSSDETNMMYEKIDKMNRCTKVYFDLDHRYIDHIKIKEKMRICKEEGAVYPIRIPCGYFYKFP